MPHFIVFIDVETTGINPAQDAIVQISAIKFFGTQEIDRFNTYINPNRSIPPEATSINSITDAMVADAPPIHAIKDKFFDFIKHSVLVGYNVTFDLSFISAAYGAALHGITYIDVMNWAHTYLDLPNYRLETVAKYLGFHATGSFHDSLTDCEATANIFWKLCVQELSSDSYIFHAPKPAKRKKFDKFCPKEIVPRTTPTDTSHPLYGKKIVFTGDLSITRHEAAQMAVDVGASVKSTVSSKTNYLIVGVQDPTVVGSGGTSGKEKKAYELNALGKASIKIITESEFMSLLGEVIQCG